MQLDPYEAISIVKLAGDKLELLLDLPVPGEAQVRETVVVNGKLGVYTHDTLNELPAKYLVKGEVVKGLVMVTFPTATKVKHEPVSSGGVIIAILG